MLKVFTRSGVAFRYPGTWTLETEEDGDAFRRRDARCRCRVHASQMGRDRKPNHVGERSRERAFSDVADERAAEGGQGPNLSGRDALERPPRENADVRGYFFHAIVQCRSLVIVTLADGIPTARAITWSSSNVSAARSDAPKSSR